jgi:aminoglycoside 3-N-acetyltransferase
MDGIVKKIIRNMEIPKNRILYLHIALRKIFNFYNGEISYQDITENIIDSLQELYHPKTIMIPTYTYSFTKSKVYNILKSKSEVGRFSEEVRISQKYYRTPNPIFSVIDTSGILSNLSNINHNSATGKMSLFHYLEDKNPIIINLGLDNSATAMQLHYYEEMHKVSYRYSKTFTGYVVDSESNKNLVNYDYFVRKKNIPTNWNRKKIKKDLMNNNIWNDFNIDKINFGFMELDKLSSFINYKMSENQKYLIS